MLCPPPFVSRVLLSWKLVDPYRYESNCTLGPSKCERNCPKIILGHEPEGRMLPTPREFCRHVLSERTTQAASNKRRLHPESGDISL